MIAPHQDIKTILYSREAIAARVKEMGREITRDLQSNQSLNGAGEEYRIPVLLGILKGALPFLADLIREIDIPIAYDLIAVSSYGAATKSSGTVRILKDLDLSIENRDAIIVEDIIDTGLTLQYLSANLKARNPRSLKICTLLDKPSRRKLPLQPDYNGFVIPDAFVVGYGLDYNERYRNLPYIGVLKEEIYQ
ncbi:MAG: hypoxanthine phosphoribosyltransferase [Firmicutes bacterium]|nr:hypoxanthine phosphoribosyltransferase [Bacillota bacterium]